MGAVLIPAGAVIGVVVGVVKVGTANQGNETANASGDTCPDPRVADWLRECRKLQGPIPVAVTVSQERPEGDTQPDAAFGAWFDACGAALERKWDSLERTRVPAICESEPVPSWWRVECLQKSAAVKKDREFNRALFESERSRFERNAPSEHCSS